MQDISFILHYRNKKKLGILKRETEIKGAFLKKNRQ